MRQIPLAHCLLILFLLPAGLVAGEAPVELDHLGDRLAWTSPFDHADFVLAVQGPDGMSWRVEGGNEDPLWRLDGPDGLYRWELRLAGALPAEKAEAIRAARASGDARLAPAADGSVAIRTLRRSGTFRLVDGRVVLPSTTPETSIEEPAASGRRAPVKQLISGDLSVHDSACIGRDCATNESFAYDTVRLKENVVRFTFEDTSSSVYPNTDWTIAINDATSGGDEYFAIQDADTGRTPFRILADSIDDAVFVDSAGKIGFGTAAPAEELHVLSGDTPTLRLEQDNSSGFAPQAWDIAGNEGSFFIRNVDDNAIVFKIHSDADANAFYIDSDDDIGFGTTSPKAVVDVDRSSDATASRTMLGLRNSGQASFAIARSDITPVGSAADNRWSFTHNGGTFDISKSGTGVNEFSLDDSGNLSVRGSFVSAGTTLNVPDYVFGDEYELMPLDRLAAFVDEHRHLPNVPSAAEVRAGGLDLTAMQLRLLEKVEELTLYTLQLQRANDAQADEIEALRRVVESWTSHGER
ncbi:MAG: hypothetical protein AAGE94_07040 [Acidobacteriota bacterium]